MTTADPGTTVRLNEAHRAQLRRSGISDEVIDARGYSSFASADELIRAVHRHSPAAEVTTTQPGEHHPGDPDDRTIFLRYNGSNGSDDRRGRFTPEQLRPGLLIPTWWGGRVVGHRIRADQPGPRPKYDQPAGLPIHLDASPHLGDRLRDPKVPLVVTEGEKKADALASAGVPAISLPGVWGWLRKLATDAEDKKVSRPLPEWADVPMRDREVVIVFDSDVTRNPNVALARTRLTLQLQSWRAHVRWVTPPTGANGEKIGVDDYLAYGLHSGQPGYTWADLHAAATTPTVEDLLLDDQSFQREKLEALRREESRRWALARLGERDAAATRGPRPKRTAREYADVPQPASVLDGVLAAEVNLLAGPSEAGKSLLARDWCLAVATGQPWRGHRVPEPRGCLLIASEGLHDFRERWQSQPGWEAAADRVHVLDEPVNLVASGDVEWLLLEYADERPGLVVFDVVYAMGLPDDNGTKEVVPLITSMKRISAEWGCATLALGHPGHSGERRFRGSSAWRQLAAVEWHLAEGQLTCEKSKIEDKRRLTASYRAEYPDLRWLTSGETVADAADRDRVIREDFEHHPDDSASARARRLMPVLGLAERRTRDLIRAVRSSADDL